MKLTNDNLHVIINVFGHRSFLFCAVVNVMFLIASCGVVKEKFSSSFKNPKSGVPAEDSSSSDNVETTSTGNGGVRGKVRGQSSRTQYLNGDPGTSLSGAKVVFPPGSLSVDTDISLEPREEMSSDSGLKNLGLDGFAQSKSTSVQVVSSGSLDLSIPFIVALPHPATAAQLMEGSGTIIVIYDTIRASDNVRLTGYFKGDQIKLNDADIRVSSKYFGTFQAIYFKPTIAPPPAIAKNIYYQPGATLLSFGGNRASVSGFTGWGSVINPFRVESGATLSTGLITRAILP